MKFPKIVSACLIACSLMSLAAVAETYPARPITLVVPFSAGGAVDANARTLAVRLGQRLKESVVVENRAGAGGAVGMASVARARPDGYTVLYTPNSIAIANPRMNPWRIGVRMTSVGIGLRSHAQTMPAAISAATTPPSAAARVEPGFSAPLARYVSAAVVVVMRVHSLRPSGS